MITQQYLQEWFTYNTETGNLHWRKLKAKSNRKFGDVLGSRSKQGYLQTILEGKNYRLHRLVYLLM